MHPWPSTRTTFCRWQCPVIISTITLRVFFSREKILPYVIALMSEIPKNFAAVSQNVSPSTQSSSQIKSLCGSVGKDFVYHEFKSRLEWDFTSFPHHLWLLLSDYIVVLRTIKFGVLGCFLYLMYDTIKFPEIVFILSNACVRFYSENPEQLLM